jgi:hypothetical protein
MAPYEEILFISGVLSFGAFVVWLIFRFAAERARERERRGRFVEAQIERFAEARAFVEFAGSEVGLQWLRADSGEMRVRRGVLSLVLIGVVFVALGAGLFVNAARLASASNPEDLSAAADASWWGTIVGALGAGSLIAAFFIARLARAWGLLPPASVRGRKSEGE